MKHFDPDYIGKDIIQAFADVINDVFWQRQNPPDEYDRILHAWQQGSHASRLKSADRWNDNPYSQRQYRKAWDAGFRVTQRILHLERENERLYRTLIQIGAMVR